MQNNEGVAVEPTQPAGRPRDPQADQAILEAALRLVSAHGFRAITVNQIAAAAHVGKMSLYRRWPHKAALVMDALLRLVGPQTSFSQAASALESLAHQLERQAAFFSGPHAQLIRSLVAEAQSDPELAYAFREGWLLPRRHGVLRTLRQAVRQGELRAGLDLEAATDQLYGPLYYRLLLGTGPIDQAFTRRLLTQFLEGHRKP